MSVLSVNWSKRTRRGLDRRVKEARQAAVRLSDYTLAHHGICIKMSLNKNEWDFVGVVLDGQRQHAAFSSFSQIS